MVESHYYYYYYDYIMKISRFAVIAITNTCCNLHIPNIDHPRLAKTMGTCTNHIYTCAIDKMRDTVAATTRGNAQ